MCSNMTTRRRGPLIWRVFTPHQRSSWNALHPWERTEASLAGARAGQSSKPRRSGAGAPALREMRVLGGETRDVAARMLSRQASNFTCLTLGEFTVTQEDLEH